MSCCLVILCLLVGVLFLRVKIEPELVALFTSRGYETGSSKALMRMSVLLMDLVLFVPGVWTFCRRFYRGRPDAAQLLAFVMICMQPVRMHVMCCQDTAHPGCTHAPFADVAVYIYRAAPSLDHAPLVPPCYHV